MAVGSQDLSRLTITHNTQISLQIKDRLSEVCMAQTLKQQDAAEKEEKIRISSDNKG